MRAVPNVWKQRSVLRNLSPWIIVLWLTLWAGSIGVAQERESDLRRAIDEYSKAMETGERNARLSGFARAEQLFRQAVQAELSAGRRVSAQLWLNLGNAALQAENTGSAILAYRRALQRAPNHAQAMQNLAHARSSLPEWARTEQNSVFFDTLFFWTRLVSRPQLAALASVCFLIAMACVGFGIATSKSLWRNMAILPGLLWLLLLGSSWLGSGHSNANAVVIATDTVLYSADSEKSPQRMTEPLPQGTEVQVLQSRDRWLEIQLSGRSGWIRRAAVQFVVEDLVSSVSL